MFKLKKEGDCYYLTYVPKKYCFVSPSLEACLTHMIFIQGILTGDMDYLNAGMKGTNLYNGRSMLLQYLQTAKFILS